jgi:ribosomal protein S18 acetylase RimI-like enzyme
MPTYSDSKSGPPDIRRAIPPVTAVLTLYPREDHLYVENVAVDPTAQGQGLGRALMEFAEQQAAERGLDRMALVTHEAMTENQAIYAHSATSRSCAAPRTAIDGSTCRSS